MPDDLEIQREESDTRGRYTLRFEGHHGEMTYSRLGEDTIIIDHTEVAKQLRGKGIAQALVRRGVEDARAEHRSIIPRCSYVRALIARTPEWQDVLKR